MAYSSADLSANELAWMADDKPLLNARNWVRGASTHLWDADGVSTFTDISASGFPATAAYDSHMHVVTKPNAAATTQYFVVDYGSEAMEIDCIFILGHNFSSVGGGLDVTVEIADDNAFSSNMIEIASWSPSSDARLVALDLDHGTGTSQRYSSVRYLRVIMTGTSHTPEIGELILGRRRQLKHNPIVPWDDGHLRSKVATFESSSGVRTQYVHHRGRRVINARNSLTDSTLISELQTMLGGAESQWGTLPIMWVDQPTTDPNSAYWMYLENPELAMPLQGPTERMLNLQLVEQGPDFVSQGG